MQFEDLREHMGAAGYRTRFEMPQSRNLQHVLLKFGAVDYFCEAYLNGVPQALTKAAIPRSAST